MCTFYWLIRSVGRFSKTVHRNFSTGSFPPPFVPIYRKCLEFRERIAVFDQFGQYTYNEIFNQSYCLSQQIRDLAKEKKEERISLLCPNDVSYVIGQWACWMTGNTVVPLCQLHPTPQLQYCVEDSQSSLLLTTEELNEKLLPISEKLYVPILLIKHLSKSDKDEIYPEIIQKDAKSLNREYKIKYKNAMILYTSGTTGPPKGAVLTHENLHWMISSLIDAWEWTCNDVILHTLPLHHMHGIVNALMCPLYIGACCVMLPKFDKAEVWNHLLKVYDHKPQITIFMAVPTMYAKLIEEHDNNFQNKFYSYTEDFIRALCKQNIRVMISGSAALPQSILERWKEITGHILLERFGMSEIGMSLSNPLHGKRIPGLVGTPLKGVEVRIVKDNLIPKVNSEVIVQSDYKRNRIVNTNENKVGELQVCGKTVFKEYWNKPNETKNSFTVDGWFKTGDIAQYVDGKYKILGRASVDIIKSGGYKISALDVEFQLLEHPNIRECAVVGLPDITWGEQVAAIIVTNDGADIVVSELREWCKERMAPYLIPSVVSCIVELPRNPMGKINKKELIKSIFSDRLK